MALKMFDWFLWRALLAGTGVALIAGAVGCFVVWRRMAYFGDSLAHSALLGIAIGLAAGIYPNIAIIMTCFVFASLLLYLQQKKVLTTDTLLGILAHAALSVGMVTSSLLNQRIDIYAYLFGDILVVNSLDLWWIYLGGAVVLTLLIINWPSLLLMTLNEDLARAEGVKSFFIQVLLMFLITIVVAVSIRIVGILLITSMLIIPAATARQLARSPELMAVVSATFGVLAVFLGIFASAILDTPSGPSIVVASAFIFVVASFISAFLLKK